MTDVSTTMNREQVLQRLETFIREQFLGEAQDDDLTPSSPLLEWGVLNSMNTARLLSFMREEFGVSVPATSITSRCFRDLDAITNLVCSLSVPAEN
jgi:acyl carrier protein